MGVINVATRHESLLIKITDFLSSMFISFLEGGNPHEEFKPLDFPCGSNFTLSVRDELLDMEVVSRMFEDKNIVNEVQQQITNGTELILLSKLYPLAEDDGYNRYRKINYDPNCHLKWSVLEILDTSETCFLLDHDGFPLQFEDVMLLGKIDLRAPFHTACQIWPIEPQIYLA